MFNSKNHPNAAPLTELQAAATALGYAPLELDAYDLLRGSVRVRGPRTGYPYAVAPEVLKHVTLREFIEGREDILEARGYVKSAVNSQWHYDCDRDDDGDRYIYDHYAVAETGKRVPLDISSNTPFLEWHEFALLMLLGFPTRADLDCAGPVTLETMEGIIFGQGQHTSSGARTAS